MRIVIDMQGLQTESRFRGIGRYTLDFVLAIVRNRGAHEIFLALNGAFPETVENIRGIFRGFLPKDNIKIWYTPGPVKEDDSRNRPRNEIGKLVREAFLASLRPDIIHITSLFEGYVDDAVTSIKNLDHKTPISISLYDLIPLLNPGHYLSPNPQYADYYERKINDLKRASIFLCISEHSRQEAQKCLDRDSESFVNVSTAIGPGFKSYSVCDENRDRLYKKFGIERNFVLYTGGADERKNLVRLIEAWSSLPLDLRRTHQMVFAGKIPESSMLEFRRIAGKNGLKIDELLFSGYVSDEELIELYNLCALYVFPSWHEGFGLPALEAMACGAPVIGANTTSLPEVIGLESALFDPFDKESISEKILEVLSNSVFGEKLRLNGLSQAENFSWDETAMRSINAWESLMVRLQEKNSNTVLVENGNSKPTLAFVSPFPPERTGIADYSAELLPELAKYYQLVLITDQKKLEINGSWTVHDIDWFRRHGRDCDRIIYQIGNSPFHSEMLSLVKEIPGTVVLHDFFLSGLIAWQELVFGKKNAWINAAYISHGYLGAQLCLDNPELAKVNYPVNFEVIAHAEGVIVHSQYSKSLIESWYGLEFSRKTEVVPLVRGSAHKNEKALARKQLGLGGEEFIICTFGFLDFTKLNHRLLHAWLNSNLVNDERCRLIFVGENNGGSYGSEFLEKIISSGLKRRIDITGYVSVDEFNKYLAAADLAVQLRTQSRGETSAAVFDCMGYGLPLIVNANGSMAELDHEAVMILSDEFEDEKLVDAIELLWRDPERRQLMGARAKEIVRSKHATRTCAVQYISHIERYFDEYQYSTKCLIDHIVPIVSQQSGVSDLASLSEAIACSLPPKRSGKCFYLDITATCSNDLKTGIERVARALVGVLLKNPPDGYRIEPIYLSNSCGKWRHRYARKYTFELLGYPSIELGDDIVEPELNDILINIDFSGDTFVEAEKQGLFEKYRQRGCTCYATVFDLLPVKLPEVFPPGMDAIQNRWLQSVANLNGAICISKAVAEDLRDWIGQAAAPKRDFSIDWMHLGADIGNSAPSHGFHDNSKEIMDIIRSKVSFLMVGTIEPRKGYLQILQAFTLLWEEGIDVNLVIVGKEGWKGLPDAMRRDIPEIIDVLKTHKEIGKRLIWLDGISDEYLEKIYANSSSLIAGSYGEGFGLPLIEAAQHRLPIIARDIPIFREVAGIHAFYFDSVDPKQLANQLKNWLDLYMQNKCPFSDEMPWLTWEKCCNQFISAILSKQ